MTIDTGFFDRPFCVLGRMQRCVTLLRLSVAGHAIDIRGIHQARRLRDTDPSSALIEIPRPTVHLLAMAPLAKGGRMSQGWDLSDLVTQGGMTVGTLDLMIGDVFLMEHLGSIFRTQKDGLIMALDTFSFGNVSISLNHADVASLTRHPSFNILPVIETPIFDFDVSLWLKMTGGAASDGA